MSQMCTLSFPPPARFFKGCHEGLGVPACSNTFRVPSNSILKRFTPNYLDLSGGTGGQRCSRTLQSARRLRPVKVGYL